MIYVKVTNSFFFFHHRPVSVATPPFGPEGRGLPLHGELPGGQCPGTGNGSPPLLPLEGQAEEKEIRQEVRDNGYWGRRRDGQNLRSD